jgi:hypothetical protein
VRRWLRCDSTARQAFTRLSENLRHILLGIITFTSRYRNMYPSMWWYVRHRATSYKRRKCWQKFCSAVTSSLTPSAAAATAAATGNGPWPREEHPAPSSSLPQKVWAIAQRFLGDGGQTWRRRLGGRSNKRRQRPVCH